MEVSGYFSLLAEEDLVSELKKLTKERITKEEEGALTDLRKKMIIDGCCWLSGLIWKQNCLQLAALQLVSSCVLQSSVAGPENYTRARV